MADTFIFKPQSKSFEKGGANALQSINKELDVDTQYEPTGASHHDVWRSNDCAGMAGHGNNVFGFEDLPNDFGSEPTSDAAQVFDFF